MEVDAREAPGNVIIVDLKGRLVAGTGAEQLKEVFNQLLGSNCEKIVLNLSEVSKIDSAGIGELVAGVRLAKKFGSSVKLLHVRGQVRDILALSQLLPLLDIYYSEEEALAAFEKDAADSDDGE